MLSHPTVTDIPAQNQSISNCQLTNAILDHAESLGYNRTQILKSVNGNSYDSDGAIWHLLLEKFQQTCHIDSESQTIDHHAGDLMLLLSVDSHIPLDPALQDDATSSDLARRSTAPTIFDPSNAELTYSIPNTVVRSVWQGKEKVTFACCRLNPFDLSSTHVISCVHSRQKWILALIRKFASMIWKVLMMTTIRMTKTTKKTRPHQPNCVNNTLERTAYGVTPSVDLIFLFTEDPFQHWHPKYDSHTNSPVSNRRSWPIVLLTFNSNSFKRTLFLPPSTMTIANRRHHRWAIIREIRIQPATMVYSFLHSPRRRHPMFVIISNAIIIGFLHPCWITFVCFFLSTDPSFSIDPLPWLICRHEPTSQW